MNIINWYIDYYKRNRKITLEKQRKKQKDKWFSWGYLILWTLLFQWIGAICYLIYKGNRKSI